MKTNYFILSLLFACVFIACDGITSVVPDDGTRYGEFNLSITYEANGLTVQFSPKHDYSGDLWYEWDFGDGTKSTQKQPTHTYSKNGTYSVVLTAGTPDGRKMEQVYETVTVKEEQKEDNTEKTTYITGFVLYSAYVMTQKPYFRFELVGVDLWGEKSINIKTDYSEQPITSSDLPYVMKITPVAIGDASAHPFDNYKYFIISAYYAAKQSADGVCPLEETINSRDMNGKTEYIVESSNGTKVGILIENR